MPIPLEGPWIAGTGPEADVVLSSRARLARNIVGFPFVNRMSVTQRLGVTELTREVLQRATPSPGLMWIDLESIGELDRLLLVERNLVSAQIARADGHRAAAIARDESLGVMVNEEDHLRMQVLASGLQLPACLRRVVELDEAIERHVAYAFDRRFGYLTACPTNVGTGMRLSVMMHLPALKITGEIDKVRRAAGDMHLAVRGFHGEGSDAAGDFYQVSNQITLGVAEEDLLQDLGQRIVPRLIAYEREARDVLLRRNRGELEDRVHRALGLLRSARLLDTKEAMKLLSRVRLGVCTGLLEGEVSPDAVNQLFLQVQPAHVRFAMGETPAAGVAGAAAAAGPLDDDAESVRAHRADLVRTKLAAAS